MALIERMTWFNFCLNSLILLGLLKKSQSERQTLAFLLWLSGLRTLLVSMRTQVPFLALLSGLRIWHCPKLWHRLKMWLGSCIAVAVAVGVGRQRLQL